VSVGTEAARARYAGDRIVTARNIGIAGIALGPIACWLALPPLTVRAASDGWVGVPSPPASSG
jgi:hypothetical protein